MATQTVSHVTVMSMVQKVMFVMSVVDSVLVKKTTSARNVTCVREATTTSQSVDVSRVKNPDKEAFLKSHEPHCEKTGLRGFRPGPTQTGLYNQTIWLEA